GRQAHKAFLCEQDILIVEEMFLDNINANTKLNELIVSPLLIDGTDGSPATIFGKLAY
ncbi:MAG: cyclase, partial [Bacteroidia bacterium]|nr:cyclase [Bacteroidia bacterium]